MAKNIGILTLTTGTVAGATRVTASQDGAIVAMDHTVAGLVQTLRNAGLTGTLKRGNGPVMQHDCRCCTFLGHSHGADHYACRGSLITRTGDDGGDYHSMPAAFMMGMTFDAGSALGAGVDLFKKAGCPGLR